MNTKCPRLTDTLCLYLHSVLCWWIWGSSSPTSQTWWISSPVCCDLWPRRGPCRRYQGWWPSAGAGRGGTGRGSRATGRDSCLTSPWTPTQPHQVTWTLIQVRCVGVTCVCVCSVPFWCGGAFAVGPERRAAGRCVRRLTLQVTFTNNNTHFEQTVDNENELFILFAQCAALETCSYWHHNVSATLTSINYLKNINSILFITATLETNILLLICFFIPSSSGDFVGYICILVCHLLLPIMFQI